MTDSLEQHFHVAMLDIYRCAKSEIGYVATRFHQLVVEEGGVTAARQLLHRPPSDGFTTLWEKGRLDLSIEYHVLDPGFSELFTDDELREARSRLRDFGFDLDRPRRGPPAPKG